MNNNITTKRDLEKISKLATEKIITGLRAEQIKQLSELNDEIVAARSVAKSLMNGRYNKNAMDDEIRLNDTDTKLLGSFINKDHFERILRIKNILHGIKYV